MVLKCFLKCINDSARIYGHRGSSIFTTLSIARSRLSYPQLFCSTAKEYPSSIGTKETENKEVVKLEKRDNQFKLTIIALQTYRQLYGDMHVPRKFIVPSNDRMWPQETWSLDLGSATWAINKRFSYTDKTEELALIGINPIVEDRVSNYPRVVEALLHYKKLMGNMNVPKEFKIDAMNFGWPENTRGIKLGKIVYNIRKGMTYVQKRGHLESIGFQFVATKSHEVSGDST